jgi:hypothetical protein
VEKLDSVGLSYLSCSFPLEAARPKQQDGHSEAPTAADNRKIDRKVDRKIGPFECEESANPSSASARRESARMDS